MAISSASPVHSLVFPRLMEPVLADRDICFVVVGATGWLGQATLDVLDATLGLQMAERTIAFGSRDREIKLRAGRTVHIHRLDNLFNLATNKRYVFLHYAFPRLHYASPREKVATYNHDDYIAGNAAITDAVSRTIAARKTIGLFIPSSGAVYRKDGTLYDDITANPYGALKLRDEAHFAQLAAQEGIPLAIFRVFNLAGPYINKVNTYALSSIILNVLRGGPVTLRASHPVIRSYVSIFDVIDLALCILSDLKQRIATPFDTAGEREIELSELAQLCATILGHPDIRIERPALREELADRYVGDPTAMRGRAVRYGIALASLPDQINETADFLRENLNGPT
jgi:nucleoside-diphosphate-sugar epimerase